MNSPNTAAPSAKPAFERLGECLYWKGEKIVARVRVNGKLTWRSTETDEPAKARQWLKKWREQEWQLRTGIQPKGIALGEIASASVPGQPGDLVQMLVHLLDNASRALQRAGRPLQGNVLVSATFESNELTLTLADKGCGMDDETLKRWGEPFFSPWGSTGLGIAMCANIVARHEGTLHVHSTPGEGTRVSVVLPAVMELEEFAMDSVSSLTDEQGGGLTDGVEIQDSWDDEEQSTDPGF